jgi:hypothetical protein
VHPDLGDHLRQAVSTGQQCCYRPNETTRWRFGSTPGRPPDHS